jgi:hypothetical protein
MDKKTIFMTILYVVLLATMFAYIGIIINLGTAQDKVLSWAFYGFSIIVSIVCVFSIIRNEGKNIVRIGMGGSTLIMFTLIMASIILSKPDNAPDCARTHVTTYAHVFLMFLINGIATFFLIGGDDNLSPLSPLSPATQSATQNIGY